jgi:DNA primase
VLCAWLERHLVDHGVTPWSALAAALAGSEHAGLAEQLVTSHALADEMELADLRRVINGIWVERLKTESQRLAAAVAGDATALEQLRAVNRELSERQPGRHVAGKH